MARDSVRILKRQLARERSAKRRDLVHAAGCVDPLCLVRRECRTHYWMINEALADGISVPRSLRKRWL